MIAPYSFMRYCTQGFPCLRASACCSSFDMRLKQRKQTAPSKKSIRYRSFEIKRRHLMHFSRSISQPVLVACSFVASRFIFAGFRPFRVCDELPSLFLTSFFTGNRFVFCEPHRVLVPRKLSRAQGSHSSTSTKSFVCIAASNTASISSKPGASTSSRTS